VIKRRVVVDFDAFRVCLFDATFELIEAALALIGGGRHVGGSGDRRREKRRVDELGDAARGGVGQVDKRLGEHALALAAGLGAHVLERIDAPGRGRVQSRGAGRIDARPHLDDFVRRRGAPGHVRRAAVGVHERGLTQSGVWLDWTLYTSSSLAGWRSWMYRMAAAPMPSRSST